MIERKIVTVLEPSDEYTHEPDDASNHHESMASSLMPVSEWADIFSNPFFRERGRPDYIAWTRSGDGAAAFRALRGRLPRATDM